MFANQLQDECEVFAVHKVDHQREAIQTDGQLHVCVRTCQEEDPYNHEEPVKKKLTIGHDNPKTDDTPWQQTEELRVGGIYRINTRQLDTYDEHIRTQADAKLLRLE